ncbi:hypothetical protein SLEP1_g27679 [Rubroshorea leprosula]|uniref:Uncharacterized protein n=1 Tax=Rubroshorea leprosula TaxID=152421 RepID=A0AAV5K0G9_9ROSI|nr:hypothetical protein SLEP1_g27679 [Rubroshorea leprosula]
MTWVYFLGSKGQALPVFKKFKALVENQSRCKIKKLKSDNGKEYTSNDFNLFCEEAGVDHQLTVSYTPQQNGIAERKNRTIMEMARCMLAEKKLPKCFWAKAVYTAVYLLNGLPTKAVKGMTPIESWYGQKPSADHLKVFGSICYNHVPAAKRGKLDEKAKIGIFIGYATQAKGYKVYDPISKKVNVHKDVVFDESAHWNWDAGKIEKGSNKQCEAGSDVVSSSEIAEVDDDSPVLKTKSLAEIYARCNLASAEPNCFEEAAKQQVWIDAMKEELSIIKKNQTWCLIPKPDDKKPIGVKWVFRTKLNPDGSIHKHKARLVVKGYAQQPGVDYGETYAPVARHDTVRLLIALVANLGWKLFHMDVKSAFLNGVLQEEIYVEQPPGFEITGKEDYVYKLNKALYGLKQAPRAWYCRIDDYLMSQGFRRSIEEATLYVKGSSSESQLILSLYVDDLLLTGNDLKLMEQFKKVMMQEFAMTYLGETKYFLGLEVQQLSKGIFICQRKYALDILKKFEMESCKPVATPLVQYEKLSKDDRETKVDSSYYRSLIGSLLYLTATRPNLMFAASYLSRFMSAPSKLHLVAAKRVLRYIKGTYELGLWFNSNQQGRLQGYADSDWAGSMEDMISTTGYVFSFGSRSFSWNSKKQDVVAQSTAKAEYLAAGAATNHAIWLRMVLEELGFDQIEPCVLKVDNMSAIAIAQNPVQHDATKEETTRKSHPNLQESSRGRMVLPFEPLTVVFQDLQYCVDIPLEEGLNQKKLQLLSDVTGALRPGVLTALMGVSGAGKTTLLDVLAGRKTIGNIKGEIKIGGYPKVQETFARIAGYCEQTDIHSPRLTVEESVTFSAWLRLAPEIDSKTKAEFVDEVLQTIELGEIKDALVGIPGVSGLSIEQRKRLTIAVELVANPSIIFLDEPTTGLDARAAAIVMRTVKNVVDTGRTIVCTIHQPSIDIFEAFHEGISGVPKIKNNYNPATWILEVTSPSAEAELSVDFAQIYKDSALCETNKEMVRQLSIPAPGSQKLHFPTRFAQNVWGQFKSCLWKQHLSYWRSPSYNLTRIMYALASSLFFGVVYWNQGQKM